VVIAGILQRALIILSPDLNLVLLAATIYSLVVVVVTPTKAPMTCKSGFNLNLSFLLQLLIGLTPGANKNQFLFLVKSNGGLE